MKFKLKVPALLVRGQLNCSVTWPTSFVLGRPERRWLETRAKQTGLSMSEIIRQSIRFAREQEKS